MGILIGKFGTTGATALEAATNGLAAIPQIDSKTLDQSLKLFGGFDRNTFEQVTAQTTQTQLAIQQAADYPKPATLLKEFTTISPKEYMVPFSDVVKNLNDPQFNVSDGLASFSRNGLGNVMNSLAQKGIIIFGGKPDTTSGTQEKGNIGREPLICNYLPEGSGSLGRLQERGIVPVDGKPNGGMTASPVPDDNKTGGIGGLQQKVIIDDGKNIGMGDLNNVLNGQISAERRTAIVQDSLLKLQKMQETTMQQLKLFQDLKYSKGLSKLAVEY